LALLQLLVQALREKRSPTVEHIVWSGQRHRTLVPVKEHFGASYAALRPLPG
jgi:hypothetical protein